jgi:hypothetical protein
MGCARGVVQGGLCKGLGGCASTFLFSIHRTHFVLHMLVDIRWFRIVVDYGRDAF